TFPHPQKFHEIHHPYYILPILNKLFHPTKPTITPYQKNPNQIQALPQHFQKLSHHALPNKTIQFKQKLQKPQSLHD
ncbi:hypothetical protein, partial [Bacillus sp. WP8]|uniref:hypothetical protein n=1 Tax=Bacillus sp. WP8 TaxID=756828 RepID=UPI001C92EE34